MKNLILVILTHQEADRIEACLDSIKRQTFTNVIDEVVVADSPSGDDTEKIVTRYSAQFPVTYLSSPEMGRSQTLNHFLQQKPCRFFMRVDARSILPNNYVERLYTKIMDSDFDVVGTVQQAIIQDKGSKQALAVSIAMNSMIGSGPSRHRTASKSGPADVVYLGVYRTSKVLDLGMFDTSSSVVSEEVDYFHRLRQAGGKIYLCVDLVVKYKARETLLQQFWLYFRYGGAKSQFIKKYGQVISLRQLAPVVTFLGLITLLGLTLVKPIFFLLFLASLGVYSGVILVFSFRDIRKNGVSATNGVFIYVFLAITLMHFGYFVGYITNLLWQTRKQWNG